MFTNTETISHRAFSWMQGVNTAFLYFCMMMMTIYLYLYDAKPPLPNIFLTLFDDPN